MKNTKFSWSGRQLPKLRVFHVIYVQPNGSESQEYALYNIHSLTGEPIVAWGPLFASEDRERIMTEAPRIAREHNRELLEGVVEFGEKVYLQDPNEAIETYRDREDNIFKIVKREAAAAQYDRGRRG